ncbi:MAG: aldehyde dehydrogenase family protein, partial [Leptospiraceae bacterium]|nr:aldehyde dehydrogenase family protein [Leptospiraceae bacterium]
MGVLKIINPATEELVTELETDDHVSIIEKFNRSMSAQLEWARSTPDEREQILTGFRDRLLEKKETLARTLAEEMGKPIAQGRAEIQATTNRINFFLANFKKRLEARDVYGDGELVERITYEPLGVIANISAWNYPYFVGSNVFVPALLTGNAVLYKPSEYASLTGLSMAELLFESGLHDEVFNPVLGDSFAGQELLKWPVQGVFFTGSYKAGKQIMDVCARRFMRVQMELGGKDPAYVREDVNIANAAASLADGAFYNTGQSCCSVERIYVHASIYDAFLESFVTEVRRFKVGNPLEEDTYIGPLAREPQLKVLERQIQDALSKGARVAHGGKRMDGKGYYFEPTVLVDVNHDMEVMQEESFGPIIGIQKVSDDYEAIRLMNDTRYGLT